MVHNHELRIFGVSKQRKIMKTFGYLLIIALALGLWLAMATGSVLGAVMFLGALISLIGLALLSIKL